MGLTSWARIVALTAFASSITALNLPTYRGLRIDQSKPGVLQIAFNNPDSEINVWSQDALTGLTDIVQKLKNDTETKAVVFKSDKPLYFMAHLDLLIQPFGKQNSLVLSDSSPLVHAINHL